MAIGPMKAVWAHSKTAGTTRLVLTLIANDCNEAGWNSHSRQKTLAEMAGGLSERALQRHIARAVELGELEVHRVSRSGQHNRNYYSVTLPGLPIFEDEAERRRRDEHLKDLAVGSAERARIERANRRSGEATDMSGHRADPPDRSVVSRHDSPDGSRHDTSVGSYKEHPEKHPEKHPDAHARRATDCWHELTDLWPKKTRTYARAETQEAWIAAGGDGPPGAELAERILEQAKTEIEQERWAPGQPHHRLCPQLADWLHGASWLIGTSLDERFAQYDRAAGLLPEDSA